MSVEFDQNKQKKTLLERGLDFGRSAEIFAGVHFTGQDTLADYKEGRFITVGWLDDHLIVKVLRPRGEVRRIISLRKANDREKALYIHNLE
jgi:uncharacterized DUF497 family protein